ncbi:MAG: tilS [Proteobacteria bacterium]|nr:tilS [Pseudomonadota bacterium]
MIARFAADLAQIWPEGEKLGLAVSGGPDSLALLLLAKAAIPERIEAATVDHGLRPDSGSEAAMVAELCAAYGIPHRILTVKVARGNLQDKARAARYAALGKWMEDRGLAALATAHHADDQAETLLMRLNRGSGVAGLAGVRARGAVPGTKLVLLRPLIGWRREELAGIVASSGLEAARDPSNEDPRFDRARLRQALKDADWLDVAAVAASAAHLAEAEGVMQWAAQREWDEAVEVGEGEIRYRPKAPGAIRIRVLARAIGMLGVEPRLSSVAGLIGKLQNGKDATLGGVVARVDKDCWTFRREPPRRVAGPD